jgi:hypothetical protein
MKPEQLKESTIPQALYWPANKVLKKTRIEIAEEFLK